MTASIFTLPANTREVHFSRRKYNRELLIDVAWVAEMPSFVANLDPHFLNFYDITLVTGGKGSFWLDDKEYQVVPNHLYFTSPGQVRRWYAKELEAICLFFPAEFLLEHFSDPLFLHRLRYFHCHNGAISLPLRDEQTRLLLERLSLMHKEIRHLQIDSDDMLRALAYEVLIRINRFYAEHDSQQLTVSVNHTIGEFRKLLEQHYRRYHKVAEYAALLSVTPGHLNVLCKQQIGRTASRMIIERLMVESARLLAHTTISIEQLSESLGYLNPSYFCRVFKREWGYSPLQYRKQKSQI